VAVANLLAGLGAGLLLGLLLDLPTTPAQRLVSAAGVALLLGSGAWLLLDRRLDDVAVGLLAGLLFAFGAGLLAGLVGGPRSDRLPGNRHDDR